MQPNQQTNNPVPPQPGTPPAPVQPSAGLQPPIWPPLPPQAPVQPQAYTTQTPAAPVVGTPTPAADLPLIGENQERSYIGATLLSWFLGGYGIDRFYLGHLGTGVAKFLTLGGFGVWTLIDQFLVTFGKLAENNNPAPLKGYGEHNKLMKVLWVVMMAVSVVVILALAYLAFMSFNSIMDKASGTSSSSTYSSSNVELTAP